MKRKIVIMLLIVSLIIITIGSIKVSSNLPNFIKNKSKVKVNYSLRPFNLSFETDKYIFYINSKSITNIKNNINNTYKNIVKFINGGCKSVRNKIQIFIDKNKDHIKIWFS